MSTVINTTVENKMQEVEILLEGDNVNRMSMLPIIYPDIWKMYKELESSIWNAQEIKYQLDLYDWTTKLNDEDRHVLKHLMGFFSTVDLTIMENIVEKFAREIKIPEAKVFYILQAANENVHAETYSIFIDVLIKDPKEKERIFNAVTTIPCVTKKSKWIKKWINDSDRFAERLVAFAVVEGIYFSGAFCCIYWFAERNLMKAFTKANDFIARDEGRHTDFACLLYNKYVKGKLSQERLEEIIKEAVDIEMEFITEAIPCRLAGMNADAMKEYIKYVANRLVKQLGHKEIYKNVKQPFSFMDRISLTSKSNFFEDEPSEYSRARNEEVLDNDFLNSL